MSRGFPRERRRRASGVRRGGAPDITHGLLKKPLMSPHPAAGLCFFAAPAPMLPRLDMDMQYGRIQKNCSKTILFETYNLVLW